MSDLSREIEIAKARRVVADARLWLDWVNGRGWWAPEELSKCRGFFPAPPPPPDSEMVERAERVLLTEKGIDNAR